MPQDRLRTIVREKYKTDAAFGLSIGWVSQKVARLLSGAYVPKLGEAVVISRALDMSLDELASFF